MNPFSLTKIRNPILRKFIKSFTKLNTLEKMYDVWLRKKNKRSNASDFLDYSLKILEVNEKIINSELLKKIPKKGSFIVVANHPLGGLEGLILTRLLLKTRPDLKVLTNEILTEIPEFKDIFIGVDVLNKNKTKYNMKGMRKISEHLKNNGMLLVFPAGTVSTLKFRSMNISDDYWSSIVVRLAKKYNSYIMPIFVKGRNSLFFYFLGHIHKRLRTLFLPRAMLSKKGKIITFKVGEIIPYHDFVRFNDDSISTNYIKMCCEILSEKNNRNVNKNIKNIKNIKNDVNVEVLKKQFLKIKNDILYEQNEFSLYCSSYSNLGPIMKQLSIEREKTFRKVGEGTGKEIDSDKFDPHYKHLFLWDNKNEKIVGGYRLGKTDEIIDKLGLKGLYSYSLFNYSDRVLKSMGRTIEVGRSFITEDYQKNFLALDMLWKGIGRFVAENNNYYTLFGCVSISSEYSKLASSILTEMFLSHYSVKEFKNKVKAKKPIENFKISWTKKQRESLSDISIINKLIGRIDAGKSIPVLIRHYLALNGKFISFSVNSGFNSSLDGLIIVDLRYTPERYLKRYMGVEGAKKFFKKHKDNTN